MLSLANSGMFVLIVAAITLPMYAVFSMLGALLGLAFFQKKIPPTARPDLDAMSRSKSESSESARTQP